MTKEELAAERCPLCAIGAPHHTNSETSIGGSDRHIVWDLHEVSDASGVGLAECLAYEIWDDVEAS
jgi:hypothetical protein